MLLGQTSLRSAVTAIMQVHSETVCSYGPSLSLSRPQCVCVLMFKQREITALLQPQNNADMNNNASSIN